MIHWLAVGIFGLFRLEKKPLKKTNVTLDRYLNIVLYSQTEGYFVAVFDVITEMKRTESGKNRSIATPTTGMPKDTAR